VLEKNTNYPRKNNETVSDANFSKSSASHYTLRTKYLGSLFWIFRLAQLVGK